MNFSVPSAFRLANGLLSRFFKAPMPSGCTLILVESRKTIFTLIMMIPFSCKWMNAFCKTPLLAQRFMRVYIVCQFPNSFGNALHLHPFSRTYNIALSTSRLLIPAALRCRGKHSSICSYCACVMVMLLVYHVAYVNTT